MKNYKFYKEGSNWYVNLPEYPGPKSDLLMIGGADTMLDLLSDNGTEIETVIALEDFQGASKLEYQKDAREDYGEGAFYLLGEYNGQQINMPVFLCDVMLFVFGDFPKQVFVKTANG